MVSNNENVTEVPYDRKYYAVHKSDIGVEVSVHV